MRMVALSMSSSTLGVTAAITSAAARPAAELSPKTATAVTGGFGRGRSRSRAMVTMPRVPSEPTIIPARS